MTRTPRPHQRLRTSAIPSTSASPPGRSGSTSALISPALPRRCKYHPTCSAYAVQAIRSYGILRGSVLAAWRLLRCNPFSHGGYDPVSAQTLFRRRRGSLHLCVTLLKPVLALASNHSSR